MEMFLRTTSHDIRTALNAITLATSLLRTTMDSKFTGEQREFLDIVESGANHMRSVSPVLCSVFCVLRSASLRFLLSQTHECVSSPIADHHECPGPQVRLVVA